jgi:hypothetical protein
MFLPPNIFVLRTCDVQVEIDKKTEHKYAPITQRRTLCSPSKHNVGEDEEKLHPPLQAFQSCMIRKPLLVVLSTLEGGLWLIFGRVTLLRPRNYFHHKDTQRFYKFLV